MPARRIVEGQRVGDGLKLRAKELRRSTTLAEDRLWQALRRNQLEGLHFRRQQVVDGYIADFYCHAIGLVVELDGEIHAEQQEYDLNRDRTLMARGLHILRFSNRQVMANLDSVLSQIRVRAEALIRVAAHLPLPCEGRGPGG